MQKLLEHIAATAELMNHAISPAAAAMMAKDLSAYPQQVVFEALRAVRNSKSRFTQDAVIAEIERLQPDGRPGPDEAWAMMPRDEDTSVVMTEEMAQALHIAQPLLDEGDQIAARKAFIEAYKRIVDTAKRAGMPPKWFPSLGHSKDGREAALIEAVRLGRMNSEHAIALLPPDSAVKGMIMARLKNADGGMQA